MLRHFALLLTFCALAAVAVYFLRLSPTVRLEAEIAQLDPATALARLDQGASEAGLDANLALMRADLALRSGSFDTARATLQGLRAESSLQLVAEERLAELARVEGEIERAAAHLEVAYSIKPKAEHRLTLGGWYRLLRRQQDELRILRSVPPNLLTTWEVERLVGLLQHERQFDALEATLETMATQGGNGADPYRARLIDFLVAFDRSAETVETAWGWFAADQDPRSLEVAAEELIARGALPEAIALTHYALTTSPQTTHGLILIFARSGHGAIARTFQARWLAASRSLGEPEWETLLEFAEITGDQSGLRAALEHPAAGTITRPILAQALAQFLRYRGPRSLIEHRRRLTPELLDEAPLIGAAWMAEQGRQKPLFAYLVAATERPMSDWERHIWLTLAEELQGTPSYRTLFEYLPADGELRTALIETVISTDPASLP
jgi:tetratricopeptide (TPR) repeat protein